MADPMKYCRICLETRETNFSLYLHVKMKYLPSVIENICGVVISSQDEPEALICRDCSEALINADHIIQKCQESHMLLKERQNKNSLEPAEHQSLAIAKEEKDEDWTTPAEVEFKQELVECVNAEENADDNTSQYSHSYFMEPKLLVESILENSLQSNSIESDINQPKRSTTRMEKKPRKRRSRKKFQVTPEEQEHLHSSEENAAALLYQSHFKTSKPKKSFVRSREQYLKRKIRNYPVKEPLTLIGGAGVVRKRKPKSYHRAIPNFYFRCELCHEFESNVASYAVTHLNTVHGIERPAIFRCSQCDAKPFIKNQSLQEHIATIHEQQPKKRDFVCQECGKTFIKNCHLQKHLLSVHKMGEMPYKCLVNECEKGYVDAYALRMHMKQIHCLDNEEEVVALITSYQCETCGKSYSNSKALNVHIKTAHSVEGFNCAYCGYNFRQKSRYDAHMRRGNCKPPCFVCRYCEKTFVKLVKLEEHQKEVH